jgi:hypothetical protein
MKKSLLFAMSAFSKTSGLGFFVLLPFVFLSSFAIAQAGLPRDAVSVPASTSPAPASGQTLAASLKAADRCGEDSVLVLPTVAFQSAEQSGSAAAFVEQAQALQTLPSNSQIWLHLSVNPQAIGGDETEKQLTDQVDSFLKSAPLSAPALHGVIVEPGAPQQKSDLYIFALLRIAVGVKGINPALRLAFVFPDGFIAQNGETVKRLATYADLLGTTGSDHWRADANWLAKEALNKPLILKLDGEKATASSYLAAALANSGSSIEMYWSTPSDTAAASQLCAANSFLAHSLPVSLLRLDAKAMPFTFTVDGASSSDAGWFGSGQSADLVVLTPVGVSGYPGQPKTVALHGANLAQFEITCFDAETGDRITATANETSQSASCASAAPFVLATIHKKASSETAVYNQVVVKAGIDLSVEEIIARWQQYREAQKRLLENYESSSFMNLHFESTAVAAPFDIAMHLRQFFDRNGKMEQEQTELFVNGVKFSSKHEFPLPQLEPEKVLSQPLELALNERYAYKLLGTETIDGAQCYVVGVEPKIQDENLYSGKIWIDGTSFREVRQTLSQRGAHSSIVVNLETQNYSLIDDGKGNRFNLLHSVSAQQTLNAAGRDFQLQRTLQFSDYVLNTPQLAADLTAAHSSDLPMFRDTDQGLRELKIVKGERVLQQTSQTRIISAVVGAMYQGTFNFPIPIAGISMADFDFRHTGAQLSTFFAGPILVNNLSKQYGKQYRLSADLALSALPGENRVYNGNTENIQEEIWAWEETVGARATWQATNHFSATGYTYLAYNIYRRTSDTYQGFEPPRNGVALLPGLQLRLTEKGYIFTADGTRGQRLNWKQFGCTTTTSLAQCAALTVPISPSPLPQSAYTLYDADLNKDYYIRKFTKAGWDMAYFGGDQLDRFSRYFPSNFSSVRLHGIPGGTDSFDAIATANVHYGLNVMDFIKFEGLYSYARARNLAESSHFKRYDGIETNFNLAGPKGTLIQGTISYALDGNIARYNSRVGATVMVFKPF